MNTPVPASWAPDVCTSPTVERPLREAEFDGFFRSGVEDVTRTSTSTAVFVLAARPAVAAQAAELATRETGCCSIFTFTLMATGGRLSLEVAVPTAHQPVLDALVERARSFVGGRRG